MCRIFGVDKEASQVGISAGRDWARVVDFEETEISIESGRVVATRNDSDWIVFEEIPG